MQITTYSFLKPIKVCHIEIRVHLTKLLAFKDGKKAHFSKLSQNKVNDIKTVIFFTTFRIIFFKTYYNKIIPQAHKGMPYRDPSSFDQVMGF